MDVAKVQKRLLEMGCSVHEILDRHHIPYIIAYGTLLGAIRHHGFIPWDDDFDVYLFDDTYDKALEVLARELPESLFLEYSRTEPLYFHGWAHIKDLRSIATCQQFPQDSIYAHHGLSLDLYKATKIPAENLTLFQLQEKKKYLERKRKAGLISPEMLHELLSKIDQATIEEYSRLEGLPRSGKDVYGFMSLDGDYLTPDELFPLKKYSFEGHLFWGPNIFDSFLRRCYGDYMQLPPENQRHPHYSNVRFL